MDSVALISIVHVSSQYPISLRRCCSLFEASCCWSRLCGEGGSERIEHCRNVPRTESVQRILRNRDIKVKYFQTMSSSVNRKDRFLDNLDQPFRVSYFRTESAAVLIAVTVK